MKSQYSSLALSLLIAFGSVSASAADTDTPPNPKAGECYARVYIPPQTETSYEQVVTKEAKKNYGRACCVWHRARNGIGK